VNYELGSVGGSGRDLFKILAQSLIAGTVPYHPATSFDFK